MREVYCCEFCDAEFDHYYECEEHEEVCVDNPDFRATAERLIKNGMNRVDIQKLHNTEIAQLNRWTTAVKGS
jgi:hypothetical protein